MPNNRLKAARLTVLLTEPLLTNSDRRMIMEDYLDAGLRDPVWWAAWTSGLISAVMQTLPPADPWRQLHSSLYGQEYGDLSTSRPATGPEVSDLQSDLEQVWSPRGWFGTDRDHTDLVVSDFPGGDRLADLGLAASHSRLPFGAGSLLAAAGQSWQQAMMVSWQLFAMQARSIAEITWLPEAEQLGETSTQDAPDVVVEWHPGMQPMPRTSGNVKVRVEEKIAPLAALRAALYRRRLYLGSGLDEEFLVHAHEGFRWADMIAADLPSSWLDQAVADGERWHRMFAPIKAFSAWSWPEELRIPEMAYDDFRVD